MCDDFFEISESFHLYLAGHAVEVVAHEIDDGVVFAQLLVVVTQCLGGVGERGVDGALHGVGGYEVVVDGDKRFRREAYKLFAEQESEGCARGEKDIPERGVALHEGACREVGQEGVAAHESAADSGKHYGVFVGRRRGCDGEPRGCVMAHAGAVAGIAHLPEYAARLVGPVKKKSAP